MAAAAAILLYLLPPGSLLKSVLHPILPSPMFGGAQLYLLPLQSYITCMRALEWLQWFVEICRSNRNPTSSDSFNPTFHTIETQKLIFIVCQHNIRISLH